MIWHQVFISNFDLNVACSLTNYKFKSSESQNTCIPEKNKTDSTSLHDDNEITTKAPLTSEDKNSFINSDVFIELIEKFGVVTVDELLKEVIDNVFMFYT